MDVSSKSGGEEERGRGKLGGGSVWVFITDTHPCALLLLFFSFAQGFASFLSFQSFATMGTDNYRPLDVSWCNLLQLNESGLDGKWPHKYC